MPNNKGKPMRISSLLIAILTLIFGLAGLAIVFLVNHSMRQEALIEAELKARLITDRNLATHTYFTRDLKPKLFEWTNSIRSSDYFEPTWMSSTYAIREINKYFKSLGEAGYYYKECAVNARSPENEADAFERKIVEDMNSNPKLKAFSGIRSLNGQPYLVVLRRGEVVEEACLRCHGNPNDAPGDLLKRYGRERSFNRKLGEIAEAISIKIPLAQAYAEANRVSLKLSFLLLGILFSIYGALFWLGRRLLFSPLARMRDKARQIAEDVDHLGEAISLPFGRELRGLTSAFNTMSINLRSSQDNLELRVLDRTSELAREAEVKTVIAELSKDLMNSTSLEEISQMIFDHARRLTDSTHGWVGYIDNAKGCLVAPNITKDICGECQISDMKDNSHKFRGLWGWVLENRSPVLTNSPLNDPRSIGTPAGHIPIHRFLSVPAMSNDTLVGQIAVANSSRDYTSQDKEVVERLAVLYVLAISRQQAQEALRDNERFARATLNSLASHIAILNADGRIEYVNDAWRSFALDNGLAPDATIGMNYFSVCDQAIRDGVEEALLAKVGIQRVIAGEVKEFSLEYPCHSADKKRWFNMSATPFADERPVRVVVAHENITERKNADQERQRLSKAIEQIAEAVMVTDRYGIIEYVNPAFERIMGYSREQVVGKNFRFFKSANQSEMFYEIMWSTIIRGQAWQGRVVNTAENGSMVEFQTAISPVKDASGIITHFVSVNRDVTHEANLEKRLQHAQKMEAIGTLAGGIAHDFNNILGAILGYTEIALAEMPVASQTREHLDQVLTAGCRARDLVKQILAFSRQGEKEKRPVQVSLVVKEVLKMMRASLPSTIDIQANIELQQGTVLADPTEIHQVLMNLCTNSSHAMRVNGGTLRVTLVNVDLDSDFVSHYPGLAPGKCIKLTVSDTGHGMNKEILERVFDPYFTTKEVGEGTGLGLAVMHGIVKSIGGAIAVYSEPGRGTSFSIYLPIIETIPVRDFLTAMELPTGNETILLVDDEEPLVDSCQQMLERLGYKVVGQTSSVEAWRVFQQQPDAFDVVITDYTMPQMTGADLAARLMEIRPDLPIIMCTGFSEAIDPTKARALGIKGFIMKPVIMREIGDEIRRVLKENG